MMIEGEKYRFKKQLKKLNSKGFFRKLQLHPYTCTLGGYFGTTLDGPSQRETDVQRIKMEMDDKFFPTLLLSKGHFLLQPPKIQNSVFFSVSPSWDMEQQMTEEIQPFHSSVMPHGTLPQCIGGQWVLRKTEKCRTLRFHSSGAPKCI